MSVQVTQTGTNVACLYDSASMSAFGPAFSNQGEAENFLMWLDSQDEGATFAYGNDEFFFGDPREYRPGELLHLYGMFRNAIEMRDHANS